MRQNGSNTGLERNGEQERRVEASRDNYVEAAYQPERRASQETINSGRVPQRSYSQDSPSTRDKESGYMLDYGNRLMRPMPGRDQDTVYERQQKPYNIISCYPREVPSVHRKFPKLTLENKLIETGYYGFNPEGY